jgi:speckle-type POZ protein
MGNTMAASEQPIAPGCAPQPKTASGTLSFEITGYRLHKGLGPGRFIRSASLNVGGFSWCLNYCPDGDDRKGSECFVGVNLELLSSNAEARVAALHMRLVNWQSPSSSATIMWVEAPTYFSTVDGVRNRCALRASNSEILRMSELEKSPYLHNDSLLIECDMTVFSRQRPPVVKTTSVVKSPRPRHRNLTRDLAMLLEMKHDADVIFYVQGQFFPAHTIVLATRSPVFKAQFHGPLRQLLHGGRQQHVTIEDMEPEVFQAFLHFIYTDSVRHFTKHLTTEDKKELMKHLLVAADRYDVQKLKFLCETFLCKSVDVENTATLMVLADRYDCSKLKDACTEFIACPDNRDRVEKSEGYRQLVELCPEVLKDFPSLTEKRRLSFLTLVKCRLAALYMTCLKIICTMAGF